MKKILLFSGFLLLLVQQSFAQQLTSKTYDNLGKLHNQALDNFNANFKDRQPTSVDDAVNYVNSFINDFYQGSSLNSTEKGLAVANNNKFKYFISENDFYNYISTSSSSITGMSANAKTSIDALNKEFSIDPLKGAYGQLLNSCVSKGIMDTYEQQKLVEIETFIYGNKNGTITIDQLENKLTTIAREFDGKNYQITGNTGHTLAASLAIGINSVDWWKRNNSLYTTTTKTKGKGPNGYEIDEASLVLPWVAADVGGAIIGATVGAISSYAGSGRVSGTSVGIGAVAGAVVASTGAAGKLGRAIFSLFS